MGRHALLEAPDAPAATRPDPAARVLPSSEVATHEVRSVTEIIAQFRREQGLADLPTRRSRADVADVADDEVLAATDAVDTAAVPATPADDRGGPDTAEIAVIAQRDAAWNAALRPAGPPPPRRHRAAPGGSAAAVIASLTAELASSNPGLLDGSPHRRRAAPAARRTAAAGAAASLQPVRIGGGLRGAALRVPALASGWRVPARTPLVLAGAVAVSVVVTDQAGLLSTSESAAAADAASQHQLATTGPAADQTAAADAAAAEGARDALARVSRLERAPLPQTPAGQGATPVGTGTAVAAAPPPDSVMKPGQTVPGDWVRPSAKGIYNSCFCARWGTFHEGIDFAAPLGSPILAVGDGVVVQAGPASGFGNWVIIKHANGDMTIYGHMKYYFVKIGQTVKAGQEIALVGEEGEATGPHLHLGVKIGSTDGHDGTLIDPVPWLTARGIAVGPYNENG